MLRLARARRVCGARRDVAKSGNDACDMLAPVVADALLGHGVAHAEGRRFSAFMRERWSPLAYAVQDAMSTTLNDCLVEVKRRRVSKICMSGEAKHKFGRISTRPPTPPQLVRQHKATDSMSSSGVDNVDGRTKSKELEHTDLVQLASHILALPVDYVPSHATTSLFSSLRQRRPPSDDDWPHNEFEFEPFVKRDLQIKLETNDQLCPRFKRGRCELGSQCTLRHCITPSPAIPTSQSRDVSRRTVCKHWLRGLCKKGDLCDYLHEYDLRRMPECRFYATFGFCNSSDECLYIHIDPSVKRRRCERYERGFCELGMS